MQPISQTLFYLLNRKMGYISDHASNACIYSGYAGVLLIGLFGCWWGYNKGQYLSGNGTRSAFPLTLNFIASGLGVGVLATYPQIGAQGGIHALFVYSLCGAIPFILFAALGPVIRKQMPEAFVLTEWVRYRYGPICGLVLSCCTILTIWLFMVSELASLKSMVETLTNVPGLPVLIVEAVVVSIYTSLGGFYVSFLTDNLQVATFLILLAVCIIATGCTVKIDKHLIGPSGLLKENKLGWKLIYIMTVAIVTNDCFMAGFWLRTFAAKTPKDLYISCFFTAFALFALCAVLGIAGPLAVWAGQLDQNSPDFLDDSNNAFYLLIHALPSWLSGFVLVFCVMLSACTYDSLQSAIVSTISNDFFRNRVRIQWVRIIMMATIVPCIVVALRAQNVLNIYLIVDVLSSCIVPVLFLGLNKYFWFITGFDIILSLIGGIIGVFVYGCVYYKSASGGGSLLIMNQGLYGDDWGAFGAFVAAPVACCVGCIVGVILRGIYYAFKTKRVFAVFDKPADGKPFHTPYDHNLFVLKKPWYEHMTFWKDFWRKVDIVFFIQDNEDMEDVNAGSFLPSWFEKYLFPSWLGKFLFPKWVEKYVSRGRTEARPEKDLHDEKAAGEVTKDQSRQTVMDTSSASSGEDKKGLLAYVKKLRG